MGTEDPLEDVAEQNTVVDDAEPGDNAEPGGELGTEPGGDLGIDGLPWEADPADVIEQHWMVPEPDDPFGRG
jgi:hypothetical protein